MSIRAVLENDHVEIDKLHSEVVSLLKPETVCEALARLDLFWARLAVHIRAEHLHLFPAVRELQQEHSVSQESSDANAELAGMIEDLRHDHDLFMRELAVLVKELRILCEEGPSHTSAIEAIRARLQTIGLRLAEHNRVEEEKIYALEDALAGCADPAGLTGSIEKEPANLPPRFTRDLQDSINPPGGPLHS